MASLVDTNVLVYVHDPRSPAKQKRAIEVLERGCAEGTLALPHQAVIEFVAATTRPRAGGPLLDLAEAVREADEFLLKYEVLYPRPEVVRTALHGAVVYGLPWYDAHLWAYAEHFRCPEILSEDFVHGRYYGSVRVVDPFREGPGA